MYFLFSLTPLISTSASTYSISSKAFASPYIVTVDILGVSDFIDLLFNSPLVITFTGTSFLGDEILTVASTLFGTISTSIELPSWSYAISGTSLMLYYQLLLPLNYQHQLKP